MSELQKLIKDYEEILYDLEEKEKEWQGKHLDTAVRISVRKRVYQTVICDLRSLL